MPDTVLSPTGSELYEIWLKTDLEVLGTIHSKTFVIGPKPGILADISPGPYKSVEAAMRAVAIHIDGTCEKYRP
jgi:hypothetical protein